MGLSELTKRFVILFLMTALFLNGAVFYEALSFSVTAAPPASTPDTATPDTAAPNTVVPNTAAPNAAAPDTAAPDAAAPNTAAPDTAAPNTPAPDAAVPASADLLQINAAGEPTALMTPIMTFTSAAAPSLRVDLIATVHFADADYYRRLNGRIPDYEAVLVELVVPKGVSLERIAAAQKTPPSGEWSLLGILERCQKGIGRALGLVNQLDAVDYAVPNMILADIDAETLFQRIAESGELRSGLHDLITGKDGREEKPDENGGSTDTSITADSDPLSDSPPGNPADRRLSADSAEFSLRKILLARDRRSALRRAFAVELTRSLFSELPFEKSLIRERNQIALHELETQITAGKQRIAILYGAAHLPDFAHHLRADFGLTPTGIEWLTAWDLTDDANTRRRQE